LTVLCVCVVSLGSVNTSRASDDHAIAAIPINATAVLPAAAVCETSEVLTVMIFFQLTGCCKMGDFSEKTCATMTQKVS
jgi:hypothetical protein